MWKALLIASGLTLAAVTAEAAPVRIGGDALQEAEAAVHDSRVQTVDYRDRYYRRDRGHHYGWYKQRRHYWDDRRYYRDPYWRERRHYRDYRDYW